MKKLLLSLLLVSAFAIQGQNQVALNFGFGELSQISSTRFEREVPLSTYSISDEDKRKILEAQYLNLNYTAAKVDQFKNTAYLRYNLYNNQMEFTKDGTIYYLKKEEGRTVQFNDSKTLYKVYEVYGNLEFLKVNVSGKNSLLVKQSSKFIPPTQERTTYGRINKPKFKRNKDEFFIALSSGKIVEVPHRKKAFFQLFDENADKVKAYMKAQKLNHKDSEDLKKIVDWLNS